MIKVITNLEAWACHIDMSFPELYVVIEKYQNINARELGNLKYTVIQWDDGTIEKFND